MIVAMLAHARGMSRATIDVAIQHIYEAVLAPRAWAHPLREIASLIGGSRSGVILQYSRRGQRGPWIWFDSEPAFHRAQSDYWTQFKEAKHQWQEAPAGDTASSPRVVRGCIVAPEWLYDCSFSSGTRPCVTGMVWRHGPVAAGFGFIHDENQREFADREDGLFCRLVPHFQQAFRLHQHIEQLRGERRALAGLLDAFPVGAILLDAHGRIIETNRRAKEVLREDDGLGSGSDGIPRATLPPSGQALHEVITRATATGAGEGGAALALRRPSGRRPLEVLVMPIGRDMARLFAPNRPTAVVFLGDPDGSLLPSENKLRSLYKLTEAEAQVALAIARGQNTVEIALHMGVQANTVRWHVKQLLAKTGTHQRAALVQLLLSGPLALIDGLEERGRAS
jgi:DNA-binding CsgD family transcriptional regulator/PAS domain-containing protein